MTSDQAATNADHSSGNKPKHWDWDPIFEHIADIPWGVLLALILAGLLASGRVQGNDIQTIRALATSAGLFGIGHGIHSGAKHFSKRYPNR